MNKPAPFSVPERAEDAFEQLRRQSRVLALVRRIAERSCEERNRLHAPAQQQLLGGERAAALHRRPVDEHPILRTAFHHAFLVAPFQAERHQAQHVAVDGADEGQVSRIHIIVVQTDEPVERVVHNRVDMDFDRILPPQRDQRPFGHVLFEKDVVVEEESEVGVAAPNPTVALHPVIQKLPHVHVQRMRG